MSPTPQWRVNRNELRTRLEARRHDLAEELQQRIARMREDGSTATLVKDSDDGDPTDLDVRLLEIATETLRRIDQAIGRLCEGSYGRCVRCRGRIAEARLRAMPFATSCRRCETAREHETSGNSPFMRRNSWSRYVVDEQPVREEP
jgi:DnaK suppressor protein